MPCMQVQNAGQLFDSFLANQTIANAVWNSGPSTAGGEIGSLLVCPNFSSSWTYQILLGAATNLNVSG